MDKMDTPTEHFPIIIEEVVSETSLIPNQEEVANLLREQESEPKLEHSNTVGDSAIICPICAKRIQGTKNLSFHMALHPIDRPQPCEFCAAAYRSRDELIAHIKDAHENEKKYMCGTCGANFCNGWRLARHAKKHTLDKPYKCAYCDFAFRNYDNWRHHEVRHRGVTEFKCEHCEVGFWNENGYINHKAEAKCTDEILCCGTYFKQRLEYVKHTFQVHHRSNLEEHPCKHCALMFPYASTKKYHENMCTKRPYNGKAEGKSALQVPTPNEQGVYMCEICDLGVKTLLGFKLHHARQHKPPVEDCQKIYQCPYCDKRCSTLTAMYGHKQIHIKKHICTVCSKKFAHRFLLRNHMFTHEKSEKPFPCKACEKSFVTKVQLLAHENCHTGFRPYKCRHCEKRFKRRTAWSYHELIHTGTRPFKCKICGVGFTQSSTCKSHEKAHERTEGKRKFHCKECPAEFWSVTQLKAHKHEEHDEYPEKMQIVMEDGQTQWIHASSTTTDDEGNIFYYVSST